MSVNDWQCWSWKDNFLMCIEVVVNLWQSQSWKVNFVCIEVVVNPKRAGLFGPISQPGGGGGGGGGGGFRLP